MTTDRRQSQGRRGSSTGGNDRRARNDRRAANRRGEAEAAAQEKPSSPEKTRGFKGFFKLVAIFFIVVLALFSLIFIVFFANLEYFMSKAGERLQIGIERVAIDPATLTGNTSRADINLRINNRLPFPVVLQNLRFAMVLDGYNLSRDATFMAKTRIKRDANLTVPISCQVDTIMMRRALQKVIENSAVAKTRSAAALVSGRSKVIAEDIRKKTVLEGIAEFRITAGGIEIPLQRRFLVGDR